MAQAPTLKIKRVLLSSLVEDPKNARKHNQRNLDAITASLTAHAQVEPLVVQASTRKVVGGNGRLSAMRALGWTHADIVEVDMGDAQAAALGITLNRTAELAEWDDAQLAETLKQLQAQEFKLDALGFDDDELRKVLVKEHERTLSNADAFGALPSGDKSQFEQMTFTLHSQQADLVRASIARVIASGKGASEINENKNGNALAFICATA